jgi:hypothetical protein
MISKHVTRKLSFRAGVLLVALVALTLLSTRLRADTGNCNGTTLTLPFTDVPGGNALFCAIAEAYFTGLTNGTTATTFSPGATVTREQMAAFVSRTQDSALRRGNKRAFMQQWWTPRLYQILGSADLGSAANPQDVVFDGADLWVVNRDSETVSRVRASDGRLLQTWTGAFDARGIIACLGRIWIVGDGIYFISPESTSGGGVATLTANILNGQAITFDGEYFWTAHLTAIARTNLAGIHTSYGTDFDGVSDILWDGANLWVADTTPSSNEPDLVRRVDPGTGAVLENITVGFSPSDLLFDGANLWVSCSFSDRITVIRAVGGLRGTVIQTITGNGLDSPAGMAFDGERVLVVNTGGGAGAGSVSLFKAADFTPLGSLSIGGNSYPNAACSDGVNFWITRGGSYDNLLRF